MESAKKVLQHSTKIPARTQSAEQNSLQLLQLMVSLMSFEKNQARICLKVILCKLMETQKTEEGRRQIQVKRMNNLAMSYFTMAFMK
jgi:hypothetical protein